MARQVEIEALPHQLEFWQNRIDRAKVLMLGGYGTGKTYGLVGKWVDLKFINGGLPDMLIEPTYKKLEDTLIPTIHEFANETLGIGVTHVGGDKSLIRWPNGWGPTYLRSGERPDLLPGPNVSTVGWDEPGLMTRKAWERGSIRARHPKAKVRQNYGASTPEGMGWLAQLFNHPVPPYYTIRARSWHPDIGPYWQEIEAAYAGSPHLLKAYRDGYFVPMATGRVLYAFDRDVHVQSNGELGYNRHLPLILTCDFNIDHMRWLVAQIHPGQVQYLDEIAPGHNTSVSQAAEEFASRYHPDHGTEERHSGPLWIAGDASGKGRNATGTVCYDELEAVVRPVWRRLSFHVPPGNPPIADSVRIANHHLASNKTGRGKRILIHPRCEELVIDAEQVVFKEGTSIIDESDPARGHALAAFRYLLTEFEPVMRPQPIAVATAQDRQEHRDKILDMRF